MIVGKGYRDIFHAESEGNKEELNRLFAVLEKDHSSKKSIDAIFRITHTLKGNALGMGFKPIGILAHALGDAFAQIRLGNLVLDVGVFSELQQGLVVLSALIDGLKTGEKVKYLGAKTKLNVLLLKLDEEKGLIVRS
jgi:two-component system chemotaxis sensor kinase CheA|tara:strand:+ start:307 stop:717 length:411 start_codon:yes stop_codon:yes gene_type:complete